MAGRPKKRIAELLSKDDPLCVLLSLISDKESFVAISRYEALKWAPVKFEALLHSELLKEVPPIRAVRCDKCEYFCSEVPVVQRGGMLFTFLSTTAIKCHTVINNHVTFILLIQFCTCWNCII